MLNSSIKDNYKSILKIPELTSVNPPLLDYIITEILPRYEKFYSHGLLHIANVIRTGLMLASFYHKDYDITFTAAAYHDLGLKISRDHHEQNSGKVVAQDTRLVDFFSPAEITIIREAVEDHRGSRKTPPRSFYGRIISDSDRDFDIKILAKRQLATSIKNLPNINDFEQHFNNCYTYISRRLTSDGHFNIWTNNPVLLERRDKFEQDFLNRNYTHEVYQAEFSRITVDGTIEKIKTYYEDF